jgi:parallel beta-helix repeat protein
VVQVTTCGQTLGSPGEYILANDLACTGATGDVVGVRITASNVTFHLAGHTISSSVCDLSRTVIGVFVEGGITNVKVDGGNVSGFNSGVQLSASNSKVKGLTVTGACLFGIGVQGDSNRVETNVVTASGSDGIILSPATRAVIRSNHCTGNTRAGVALSDGAYNNLIAENVLDSNGGPGGEGYGVAIFNGIGNTVRDNAANRNNFGIRIASAVNPDGLADPINRVLENVISGNSHLGIWVESILIPANIRRNSVFGNGIADMQDDSANCGANTWRNNTFLTDLVAGVPNGGPSMPCLR